MEILGVLGCGFGPDYGKVIPLIVGALVLAVTVMVGLVVVTLQRHKLQEAQGRWLKLISGLAILVLGTILLLRPEWIGREPHQDLQRGPGNRRRPVLPAKDPFHQPPEGFQHAEPGTVLRSGRDTDTVTP